RWIEFKEAQRIRAAPAHGTSHDVSDVLAVEHERVLATLGVTNFRFRHGEGGRLQRAAVERALLARINEGVAQKLAGTITAATSTGAPGDDGFSRRCQRDLRVAVLARAGRIDLRGLDQHLA